jgi:hypothetical protein
MLRSAALALSLAAAAAALAGCDMLGIDSPEKLAAAREADGRAVGAACRHAGRAIEDCYLLNKRVDKAAIFAGWRDMNDYMRENKIESVTPVLMAQVANGKAEAKPEGAKPAETEADKPGAKTKARDTKEAKSQGS